MKNIKDIKEKEVKSTEIDIKSLLIGVLATALIAVAIALIVVLSKGNETTNDSIQSVIDNSIELVKLDNKETKEIQDTLLKAIDNIVNNNGYVQAYTDEDTYNTYIYNNKGEVVSQGNQTGYLTVIRSDGSAVQFTDTVYTSEDIDVLSIARNAVNSIGNNGTVIKKLKSDVADMDELTYLEYRIDMSGWEAVKDLYRPVSENLAELMVLNMQETMGEDWEPIIYFYFIIGTNGEFTVACHIVESGQEYTNWYVDGYSTLDDWELSEDWYTYDFSDEDKSVEMCESLIQQLYSLIEKYAYDNGIDLESEESIDNEEEIGESAVTESENTVENEAETETEETETNLDSDFEDNNTSVESKESVE